VKAFSSEKMSFPLERLRRLFCLGALFSSLTCSGWSQAPSGAPIVDRIVVQDETTGLADTIREMLAPHVGQPGSTELDAAVRTEVLKQLEAHGYFEATVTVTYDAHNLLVSISPGRQYHISAISAGGGPLLPSRDLSPSFTSKPGDLAGAGAFGRVPEDLRTYYWRYGYADVQTNIATDLDRQHATVAYRMDVAPGPLYHVGSLTIQNLSPEQENRIRVLLGLKSGDVFDQTAVTGLYRKIAAEPSLSGYGFTFTPKENKTTAVMDVVLDFYKKTPGNSIIFR
jgi:outer membrane protein assembly factor BamA